MNSEGKDKQVLFQEKLIKSVYPQFSYQKFEWMLNTLPWLNYSLGCMFGSFIGDSLGAYVQFSKNLDEKTIGQAISMIPGGTFNLRAGQVTDDSQMSFHLLEAILKFDPNQPFISQKNDLVFSIAEQYVKWKKSKPFDIGNTCKSGISVIQYILNEEKPKNKEQRQKTINKIHQQIKEVNIKSQSNGSLMKITPLIFFAVSLSLVKSQIQNKHAFRDFVKDEIKLIHSNQAVTNSSLMWYGMLYQICKRTDNSGLSKTFNTIFQNAKKYLPDWAKEIQSKNPMQVQVHQGWAKIAWSYGMRYFKKIVDALEKNPNFQLDHQLFKRMIKNIISFGGDTDTNAAIIGGMLGSLIGFKGLPKDYLKKMFSLDFTDKSLKRGHDRPSFYQPRRVFVKIYQFVEKIHAKINQQPSQKAKY